MFSGRPGRAIKAVLVAGLLAVQAVAVTPLTAHGASAVTQSFGNASTSLGTSLQASTATPTGAGDLLVATIKARDTTSLATVTGLSSTSATTSWVKATAVTQGTQSDEEIWYASGAPSVSNVTVSVTGASAISFTVVDVSGAAASPLDQVQKSSGSSASPSTGTTAATTSSSEVAVAALAWNTNAVPSKQTPGYTTTPVEQSTITGTASGEQAASAVLSAMGTQTYGATLSASVAWTGAIATFKLGTTTTAAPVITGFSPTSGPVGTSVTINGSGFTGLSGVSFNGMGASTYAFVSDAQVTATVPSGATSGPIAVSTSAGTGTSSTSFTVTAATAGPPHVLLVVEENQEYGSIIGSSNAPYLNSLASTYRSASSWYAVQHNSPDDYLELLAGSNLGFPNGVPYSATTLVDEQHSAGISWQAYMESMPSTPCWKGSPPSDGLYTPIHNPYHVFRNYTTNAGGWCSNTNLGTEGVLSYPGSSGLLTALGGANAPDFVQITPNNCDDMHGDTNTGSPCASATKSQLVSAGDTWLSNNIGPVINSPWFAQNGIIIITWDEGTTSQGCCGLASPGGHIATLVVSSTNKGLGQFTGTGDHYGTLRGIEEAYKVPYLGASSQTVNGDLGGAF